MLLTALTVALIAFAGIFVACKGFGYEISLTRMVGAAVCFAVLDAIPVPQLTPRSFWRIALLFEILIPAVGLYVCLMDDRLDRDSVNKVFALSYLTALAGSIGIHYAMN